MVGGAAQRDEDGPGRIAHLPHLRPSPVPASCDPRHPSHTATTGDCGVRSGAAERRTYASDGSAGTRKSGPTAVTRWVSSWSCCLGVSACPARECAESARRPSLAIAVHGRAVPVALRPCTSSTASSSRQLVSACVPKCRVRVSRCQWSPSGVGLTCRVINRCSTLALLFSRSRVTVRHCYPPFLCRPSDLALSHAARWHEETPSASGLEPLRRSQRHRARTSSAARRPRTHPAPLPRTPHRRRSRRKRKS